MSLTHIFITDPKQLYLNSQCGLECGLKYMSRKVQVLQYIQTEFHILSMVKSISNTNDFFHFIVYKERIYFCVKNNTYFRIKKPDNKYLHFTATLKLVLHVQIHYINMCIRHRYIYLTPVNLVLMCV